MKKGVDRQAGQLVPGCRARKLDRGGVGEDDALAIVDQDAVGSQFDELSVSLVALPGIRGSAATGHVDSLGVEGTRRRFGMPVMMPSYARSDVPSSTPSAVIS